MLSKHEQARFEQVCLEHIWAAVGMHVLCSASGSEADARSAATSVRDLVNVAPAYRACWERVKPVVRTQGFRSFISIVDSATPYAGSQDFRLPEPVPQREAQTSAPTPPGLDRKADQHGELVAERVLAVDTRQRDDGCAPEVQSSDRPIRPSTPASPPAVTGNPRRALPLGRLRVLEGKFSGRELELSHVLTEFGKNENRAVAILRQKNGYSIVATRDGAPDDAPQVNGTPIGSRSKILKDNDIVQIAGIKARFMLS